jgi:uncharacterized protein YoaH (UPF0181 family)
MVNYIKMSKRVSGPGVMRKSPRAGMGVTKAPKGVAGMGKLMSQGMSATAARNLMNKIRENKPTGRISQLDIKEALDKYKMKMPRKIPNPKDPMQARPLPITPQDRKRINERKVPNPRAKSTLLDEGPKMVKPLRRTLARRK